MSFEYSTFPKSLDYPNDSTAYLSDLTADDWMKIRDYNQALIDGRVSDFDAILEKLDGRHITAKDINKIIDCIRAIETAYFNNTVKNNEIISNGDFNDMKTPGIYTMRASSANSPASEGKYYGLIVLKSDTVNFIEQIAFRESRYDVYIRYLNNSGWGEWRKINDGGNADTVDGKHASDFAEAEHSHDNYLPLSGGTISDSEEHINITPWGIQGNNNSEIYNFYSVSAQKVNAGEINENGKALPDKYSEKEHTHTIDQITDFTPDSIINSSDFTKYEIFTNLEELSETMYDGLFYISDSQITGISLKSGQETDMQPDKTVYWDVYTRIYFDNSGNMYVAVDKHDDETDFWLRKFLKTFSPNSSDSHTHTRSQITDFPTSLPANGGNADTIAGIGIDGIQTKQTGISSYTDWNDIVEPGFHKLMERGTENSPDGGDWFFPIVFAYSSSGITQLAAAYRYDWIYMRHKKTLENGTIGWTEWRKIGGAFEQTVKTGGTDLNTLHGSTELYNLQGDFTNGPDGAGSWGSLLSLYGTGSRKTIQVYFPDTGNGAYTRRCTGNGSNWNEWVNIGDGGNAKSVNKKIKNFTVQTGSWFRLARNNKDSCGGVFVLTVGSGSSSSTTVFSASQQYSSLSDNTLKLKCLSHSHFNSCVTKLRAVNQSGSSYEQYIDFYIAGGTNGLSGDVEVQFFGKGWIICDSIESSNIASGYTATEISL